MERIFLLSEDMHGEIRMADHYYRMALFFRDTSPEYEKRFIDMAKQEIDHALILHDMAERYISGMSDVPDYASSTWQQMHIEYVDCIKELEYKLSKI